MRAKVKNKIQSLSKSKLVKGSFWGIAGNGIQTILLSLFFVIMARKFSKSNFAVFLIATNLYQFLAAFSTLGLGQWFTREIVGVEDKSKIVTKFLKLQIISGLFFYAVNIALAFLMYSDKVIWNLSIILGINIIFDNIIYAIRSLNVAEHQQKKSFLILTIDSVLKFSAAAALYLYPFSIITIAIFLIVIRFITLNFFLSIGSSKAISIGALVKHKISKIEVKEIILKNWAFIIIGSISMIYWSFGKLIISKLLTEDDVSNYEVSFRVFSLSMILPIIISTSIFPQLVALFNAGDTKKLSQYFYKIFNLYLLYSLVTYTFFYSFSDTIIPWAFGEKYVANQALTKQMFLTILVFPTALLQASMLVAIRLEKADMWLNIVSLAINIIFCFVGLYFFKNISVVNFAIFFSFLIFHICQDVLLVKHKMSSITHILKCYIIVVTSVGTYIFLLKYIHPMLLFVLFWFVALIGIALATFKLKELKNIILHPQQFSFKNLIK
jgi:O-antigen/teichoic acid export membrane protein